MRVDTIGKVALLTVLADGNPAESGLGVQLPEAYRVYAGRVGSTEPNKIFAAIETAARRQGLLDDSYRTVHALYHASLEAFHGVCRGQVALGDVLRTVGLRFSVAVGPRQLSDPDTKWVAVALFGTIGAPIKGFEHEAVGLGINHI